MSKFSQSPLHLIGHRGSHISVIVILLLACLHHPAFGLKNVELAEVQLLVNPTVIQSRQGFTERVHSPSKQGQVIKPEYKWEEALYMYTSVVQVDTTN